MLNFQPQNSIKNLSSRAANFLVHTELLCVGAHSTAIISLRNDLEIIVEFVCCIHGQQQTQPLSAEQRQA